MTPINEYSRRVYRELGPWPLAIAGLCFIYMFVVNWPVKSLPIDGFMWLDSTHHFFANIWGSAARNRPLYPFLHWIFVGPVTLIPGVDDNSAALYGWRVGNWVILLLSMFFAFDTVRRVTRSPHVGFFFGFMVLTAASFYTYIPHTGTQSHGYFTAYLSFWVASIIKDLPPSQMLRAARWAGLGFGILMLGKPQFNILGAFLLVALVQYLRTGKLATWMRATFLAFGFHLIPILFWLGALHFIGQGIAVFELSNPDFSVAGYYREEIAKLGVQKFIFQMPARFWLQLHEALDDGVVSVAAFGVPLTMGIIIFTRPKLAPFVWCYFWATTLYLFATRYLYSRHGGDLAPIFYLGVALLFDRLRRDWGPVVFWRVFSVFAAFWVVLNTSWIMTNPIIDQCEETVPPEICKTLKKKPATSISVEK